MDLASWPSLLTLTGTELAERWARSQLEWFEKTEVRKQLLTVLSSSLCKKWAEMGEMGWKVVLLSFALLYHRKSWHFSPLHCVEGRHWFLAVSILRCSGMGMTHSRSKDKCWVNPAKFSIFTCWSLYNQKGTNVVNIFLALSCYMAFEF